MFRVLVTSSRTWRDFRLVWSALDTVSTNVRRINPYEKILVTHGDCSTGGDRHARRWAKNNIWTDHDPHPADWDKYGKRAGPLRNERMVDLHPDFYLAFLQPCDKSDCKDGPELHWSHGASHTLSLCEFEKIPGAAFYADLKGKPLTDTFQKV